MSSEDKYRESSISASFDTLPHNQSSVTAPTPPPPLPPGHSKTGSSEGTTTVGSASGSPPTSPAVGAGTPTTNINHPNAVPTSPPKREKSVVFTTSNATTSSPDAPGDTQQKSKRKPSEQLLGGNNELTTSMQESAIDRPVFKTGFRAAFGDSGDSDDQNNEANKIRRKSRHASNGSNNNNGGRRSSRGNSTVLGSGTDSDYDDFDDDSSADPHSLNGTMTEEYAGGTYVSDVCEDFYNIVKKHRLQNAQHLLRLLKIYKREVDVLIHQKRHRESVQGRIQAHRRSSLQATQQASNEEQPHGGMVGTSSSNNGNNHGSEGEVQHGSPTVGPGTALMGNSVLRTVKSMSGRTEPTQSGSKRFSIFPGGPGGGNNNNSTDGTHTNTNKKDANSSSGHRLSGGSGGGDLQQDGDGITLTQEEKLMSVANFEYDEDDTPPALFSFRQLASWKLALQRSRERDETKNRKVLRERHEDSIFSEQPLEKDDYAEVRLEPSMYATEEQLYHDSLIKKFRRHDMKINLLITFLMLYEFTTVLFRAFFETPRQVTSYLLELFFVEIPLILWALSNIFSLQEEKGILKVDFKKGAKNYIFSMAFVLDLLGLFPIELIGRGVGYRCTDFERQCGFVAPYWHLNKILLTRSGFSMFDSVLDQIMFALAIHPSVGRIIHSFVNLTIFSHTAACMLNIMLASDQPLAKTWVGDATYFNRTISDKYFVAMDWSTKSIIGYTKGDPFDQQGFNPDKCALFTLAVTIVGLAFVSAFIGSISSYLSKPSPLSKTLQKIDEVIDEGRHRDLPEDFIQSAINYHWHTYQTTRHSDNAMEVLGDMPKHLQIRVLAHIGVQMVKQVPLLSPYCQDEAFVMCLVVSLVPVVLMPYTTYFKKGEKGNSMAFITWGTMGVVPINFNESRKDTVLFTLRKGMFFGEIALILGTRRTATIASLDQYTNIMELRKDNFLQLQRDFPEVIDHMQTSAQDRMEQLNQKTEDGRKTRLANLRNLTDFIRMFTAFKHWCEKAVPDTLYGENSMLIKEGSTAIFNAKLEGEATKRPKKKIARYKFSDIVEAKRKAPMLRKIANERSMANFGSGPIAESVEVDYGSDGTTSLDDTGSNYFNNPDINGSLSVSQQQSPRAAGGASSKRLMRKSRGGGWFAENKNSDFDVARPTTNPPPPPTLSRHGSTVNNRGLFGTSGDTQSGLDGSSQLGSGMMVTAVDVRESVDIDAMMFPPRPSNPPAPVSNLMN